MTARRRALPLTVLVVALIALVASTAWAAGGFGFAGPGPGNGWPGPGWAGRTDRPMMGPARVGEGPVRSLADADRAAQRFADRWGLRVGEVMQFSNHYYAELVDAAGAGATEVIVDPASGAVHPEWGPAMMWNTAFGAPMHRDAPAAATIGPDEARRIAEEWLQANRGDLRAGEAEAFPGYYTLHTLRGEQVDGMLSVHAGTGAVWYHTWHGDYVGALEHPPPTPR